MGEELKTLKDLEKISNHIYVDISEIDYYTLKEVKKLAIKWIKEEIFLKINRAEQDLFKIDNLYNSIVHSDKIINRWMKRFDLTEKDLK